MNNNKQLHAVVRYFFPVAAGIETNMLETYSAMAKSGWDITIHTTKDTHNEKNILADTATVKGLKVVRYPYQWYSFWPKIDWQAADVVALHNFDIVPQLYLLVYVGWLKLIGKKKFILELTPHGGFTPEWRIFSRLAIMIKKTYHYSLGTFLINQVVDGIRAVSGWEKDEISLHGVHKHIITIIANGIEDEAYLDVEQLASPEIKKQVKSYGKYLIQIGRIYSIKNYETAIKALAKLPNDIHYVIAGATEGKDGRAYLESLHQLIKELGLTERIHFVGVVRGVDKYYLIRQAQMIVHMAIWESFCNVVHEGMSQGLIPVVADNSNLRLLVKNGVYGYCVDTHDHQALAEKLKYVLDHKNSDELKQMSKRNSEYALQHSWAKVADKVGEWSVGMMTK